MHSGSRAGKERSQTGSTPNHGCEGTRNERHESGSSQAGLRTQEKATGLATADSAMHGNEDEEVIITSIRAMEVASGLRRTPVGFYAAIHHSGLEWRTENKPSSVNRDVIKWTESIPIPSDPSATVRIEVYASFEFQPMLGTGEQLRKLSITVEQLLNRSAKDESFTFFPKAGGVVSSCSAISVTTELRKRGSSDSSMSIVRPVQSPTTQSRNELEHATNEGHSALLQYQKHGSRRDLERSIELFEQVLRICPSDHPCRAAAQSNLATAELILFRVQGTDGLFEAAFNLYHDALSARPVGHVDRPSTLIHLAVVFLARFERLRGEADEARAEILLYEAMQLSSADSHQSQAVGFVLKMIVARKAHSVQPDGQSSVVLDPPPHLTNEDLDILSIRLLLRFERFGDLADLQQGIAILEQLIRVTSVWDDRYSNGLRNLGSALSSRFERLGELKDLEDAVSVLREAVDLTRDGHSYKPARLHSLGNSLLIRFRRLGEMDDLDDAILQHRHAVDLTPHDHADRPDYLGSLGMCFWTRFERLGELGDLEVAISTMRNVVALTPHGVPHRPGHLHNLGATLASRFKSTGVLADLEEAISVHRDAVDATPHDHREKPMFLNNLGTTLFTRYEHLGKLDDLEDAISTLKNAATLTPRGHPQRSMYLGNLGMFLRVRFECLGELRDLEDAISMLKEVVDLTENHLFKPGCLSNLGNCFLNRFQRLGQLRDLEDAIARLRDAVALTPHDRPRKPVYLGNLGNSLYNRFQSVGELRDLEEAISIQIEVVNLALHGDPDRHIWLTNLGTFFYARFEHLGEPNDLEDAILTARAVVGLPFHSHPHKHVHLGNLGHFVKTRFDRFGRLDDLEEAMSRHREAIEVTPYGHPRLPSHLNDLGICFTARFEHFGKLNDLDQAISLLRDAVNLLPDDHPDQAPRLRNLGIFLITRFEHLGDLCDIDEAIAILRVAVRLTRHGHPDKPRRLIQFGNSFLARFKRIGDQRDIQDAISLYAIAASAPFGPTRDRFHASQRWISCARLVRHRSLLHACSVAINLLPQLAWIGLSLDHRYFELMRGADVVREAAAAALDVGFPEIAVEWLERGRSVVWGELFQLRSSYDQLSSEHPDLARKLCELSAALEHASTARERSVSAFSQQGRNIARDMHAGTTDKTHLSTLVQESERARQFSQQEAHRHRMLAIKRDQLLLEIRRLPGFERFLLQREFSQLRASAHAGPVVILNAAENRCDALIILADVDHVIHVPLPRFTFKRSAGLQNMLENLLGHARTAPTDERIGRTAGRGGVSWESLLSTLWEDVVKHVLHALAFSSAGELSRIFWCPTGPFTFLPIHAAGLFDIRYSQPGHKVFDFVISSYVPTLSILPPPSNPDTTPGDNLRLLFVRQPSSDGLSRLPGVVTELQHIRAITRYSLSARTTLMETSAGTVEEVLEMMKSADWVHFACHGIQDGVDSGLCLADERRLRVRDIIAFSRPRGGLAFLSACQTAMGEEKLSDEAIHVAAGMLFAGYEGVIGTMWSISDKLAPDVARDVYGQLLRGGTRPDHRQAARALHEAIGRIRDDRSASFVTWLPFIHVGL